MLWKEKHCHNTVDAGQAMMWLPMASDFLSTNPSKNGLPPGTVVINWTEEFAVDSAKWTLLRSQRAFRN
jgi:hypothetical protein